MAEEQDAELVERVMIARVARRAVDKIDDKTAKPTDTDAAVLKELFDALDRYDEERGIPEEA